MKKLLLVSFVLLTLMSSCKVQIIKILQPQHVTQSTLVNYPFELALSGYDISNSGNGTFKVVLPSQMELVLGDSVEWLVNGIPTMCGVAHTSDANTQTYTFTIPVKQCTNALIVKTEGSLSLRPGSATGTYSILYEASAAFQNVQRELPITVLPMVVDEQLAFAQFFKNTGLNIAHYDFYVTRLNPSQALVQKAKLFISQGTKQAEFDLVPIHPDAHDYFTRCDSLFVGANNYRVSMYLDDGTALTYPETGYLPGPTTVQAETVQVPFTETFALESPTLNKWSCSGASLGIGIPSQSNNIANETLVAEQCIGSNIEGNGFLQAPDTSYVTSPIIDLAGQDSLVIDYYINTKSKDSAHSTNVFFEITYDFENWHPVAPVIHSTQGEDWSYRRACLDTILDFDYCQFRWGFISSINSEILDGFLIDRVRVNGSNDYMFNGKFEAYEKLMAKGDVQCVSGYIYNTGSKADSYTLSISQQEGLSAYITDADSNVLLTTPVLDAGDSIAIRVYMTTLNNFDQEEASCNISIASQGDQALVNNKHFSVVLDVTHGGPDFYGYTWVNDRDSSCAPLDWIDNSTHYWTYIGGSNYIGYNFEFYGNKVDQFYISEYGKIYFTYGDNPADMHPIPTAGNGDHFISFLGAGSTGGSISYGVEEVLGNQAGVITITGIEDQTIKGQTMDVQILLLSNNDIRIQYRNITPEYYLTGALVGIENANGTDGLQYQYGVPRITNNSVVEFRHPQGEAFHGLYPAYDEAEISQFQVLRWDNCPRYTDSITLYIREGDNQFTEADIAYSGAPVFKHENHGLAANTHYYWRLYAHHGDQTVPSIIAEFNTTNDRVDIYGQVYAEDSITPISGVTVSAAAQYQMGREWYYGKDSTTLTGDYALSVPMSNRFEFIAQCKGYSNHSEHIQDEDLNPGNQIDYTVYLSSLPEILSFTFNEPSEFILLADSFVFAYVDSAVNIAALTAQIELPIAVNTSVDLSQAMDYSDTVQLRLTTRHGLSQNYYIIVQARPDLSMYERREIHFNHEGQAFWVENRMHLWATAQNFAGYNGDGVGLWPGELKCAADSTLTDKIAYAEMVIEEGCGEGCTMIQGIHLNAAAYTCPVQALAKRPYSMDMRDVPVDTLIASSFEAMMTYLTVWVDINSEEPYALREKIASKQTELAVFPNPTQHTLKLSGVEGAVPYQVFALDGQCVKTGSYEKQLDVSMLKNGIYFITLKLNNERHILRFIKQ